MLPAIGSTMIAAICAAMRVEQRVDRREVVVAREQRVGRDRAPARPGWSGMPSVSRARAGLHEKRVGVAVIAAFELDDLVAAA